MAAGPTQMVSSPDTSPAWVAACAVTVVQPWETAVTTQPGATETTSGLAEVHWVVDAGGAVPSEQRVVMVSGVV